MSDTPPSPDPRMLRLAELTEPSEAEVRRVYAKRVTRVDQATAGSLATHTDASWAEQTRIRNKTMADAPGPIDPRARTWAKQTRPTEAEVARVISTAPDASVAEATSPLPHQIQALVDGRVPATWQAATEPTQAEVNRLLERRAELVAGKDRRLPAGLMPGVARALAAGTVAAAALAIFGIWSGSQPGYGTPGLPVGTTAVLQAEQLVELGPSIDLEWHDASLAVAEPTVRIARADARGTIVDVLDGGTRFEVDPNGAHRHLTVRARDVEVVVKGTVFTVDTLPDRVVVGVERGRVQVSSPAGQVGLVAGETWSSDVGLVATREPTATEELPPAHGPAPVSTHAGPAADSVPVAEPVAPQASHAPAASPTAAGDSVASTALSDSSKRRPVAAPDADPAGKSVHLAWPPGSTSAAVVLERSARTSSGEEHALQLDLAHLRDIGRRQESGEDPVRLITELDAFVAAGTTAELAGLAAEIRVDLARDSGRLGLFEEAIDTLAATKPDARALGVLHLELGNRYYLGRRMDKALRAFEHAAAQPGDLGVRGLQGQAQAYFRLGQDRRARQALDEALRRVSDPGLEDELEAMRSQLQR